jgi:thiol-disulfide isomerase/thioredoxin
MGFATIVLSTIPAGAPRTTGWSGDNEADVNARLRYGLPAALLVLISVGAVRVAARTDPSRLGGRPADPENLPVGKPAGPLDGATGWINTPPLAPADLAGKVVVYDFWTYSCVNCVRTLPYLRAWHERYTRDGAVIVGVHSPEFDFEYSRPNVEAAVRRLGVTWPVAVDNNKAIWDTFKNAYWPAKFVADREGKVRYHHIGEGAYQETEDVLRSLLGVDPASPRAALPSGRDDTDLPPPAGGDRITPETYLGTTRGTAGARPGLITYPEPGPLATGECRLAGPWGAEQQKVTAAAAGAAIVLAYRAREVNLVMTPPRGGAVDVQVDVDGRPLPPDLRTEDTLVDGAGATYVHVDHDGLYRLVLSPDVAEHTVRLTARQPEVAAFAFTFGP